MEWQAWKASLCECGHPRSESFHPDRRDAYKAEVLVCHACATRERKRRAFQDADNADTDGVYFPVFEDDG